MNETGIDVSNYQILETGASTITSYSNDFSTSGDKLTTCKSELSNQEVFLGPVCDEVMKGFTNVSTKLADCISKCGEMSTYLVTAAEKYKNGDASAANTVLNEDGTISVGAGNSFGQKASEWAVGIANDDSYGYKNGGHGKGGYDCTQLVHAAYEAAGISLPNKLNVNNENIVDYYTTMGFTWTPGPINPNDLQAGDVLVNKAHHAEIYIGNGQKVGAHSNYDGSSGDSGGNEISVDAYKEFGNGGWDGYLRYTG